MLWAAKFPIPECSRKDLLWIESDVNGKWDALMWKNIFVESIFQTFFVQTLMKTFDGGNFEDV